MGGRDDASAEVLRRFARDQWVRSHGTPRVTVLAGAAHARRMWERWLEVCGLRGALFDDGREVEASVRAAAARAVAEPELPVAVLVAPDALAAWRRGRTDRLAAMVSEGLVAIGEAPMPPAPQGRPGSPGTPAPVPPGASSPDARRAPAPLFDARSAAEAAMFEALEATPATAGRFELNARLSVHFGDRAAEVDLLSRRDRIAIEIDGYYHFADLDAYRRDRRKDLLLQLQGLVVIRLHAQDVVKDARPGVTAVCQALAFRMEPAR